MFFGFQLTCGLMLVFYGYSVMKIPVSGEIRAVRPSRPKTSRNTAARTVCFSSRRASSWP